MTKAELLKAIAELPVGDDTVIYMDRGSSLDNEPQDLTTVGSVYWSTRQIGIATKSPTTETIIVLDMW